MAYNPNATMQYYASDMILNILSEALYLPERKSESRASENVFLGWIPRNGKTYQGQWRSLHTVHHSQVCGVVHG